MEWYACEKCKCDKFQLTNEVSMTNSNMYGYQIWKLQCSECGEFVDDTNFQHIISTFHSTKAKIGETVESFNTDMELLKCNLEKMIGINQNIGELEALLRKLKFIYLKENADAPNSINIIASIIAANLPNEIEGIFQTSFNEMDNNSINITLNLKNSKTKNVGAIVIERAENNIFKVDIKKKDKKKKGDMIIIDKPFRVIQVLLRINELFSYTI